MYNKRKLRKSVENCHAMLWKFWNTRYTCNMPAASYHVGPNNSDLRYFVASSNTLDTARCPPPNVVQFFWNTRYICTSNHILNGYPSIHSISPSNAAQYHKILQHHLSHNFTLNFETPYTHTLVSSHVALDSCRRATLGKGRNGARCRGNRLETRRAQAPSTRKRVVRLDKPLFSRGIVVVARSSDDHDKRHRTIINNAWNDKYSRAHSARSYRARVQAEGWRAINHSNRIKYKIRRDGSHRHPPVSPSSPLHRHRARVLFIRTVMQVPRELTYFLHANARDDGSIRASSLSFYYRRPPSSPPLR